MKTDTPFRILDQNWIGSHIALILFSAVLTLIVSLSGKYGPTSFSPGMFIILFLQLEVFISTGSLLFARMEFDNSPADFTKSILLRFIIFLIICMTVSIILFILVKYLMSLGTATTLKEEIDSFFSYEFKGWYKSTVSGFTVGAIIFIFLLWQTSLRREAKLREEKLIFQNETLRSQVNPHFLFNSLNTISSLIKSQPDVAESFINNLSSVYRYILEYGQKERVKLGAEVEFVERYYDLHRIRDDGKIQLEINIHDDDLSEYEILPVSLQILIENAIKHNMATRENPLFISMYREDKYIVVKNNLQKKATQLKSTGIGLKNLSERIRLSTKQPIVTEETNNEFIVKIPLLP